MEGIGKKRLSQNEFLLSPELVEMPVGVLGRDVEATPQAILCVLQALTRGLPLEISFLCYWVFVGFMSMLSQHRPRDTLFSGGP